MRRRAALVLLSLAVFFAATAPMLRWYAFPRLAKIPKDHYQEVVLVAENATLLDYETLKPRRNQTVTIVQTLKGNVEEARKARERTGRDVVVWDALSYVADSEGELVSKIPERYVFDAHTQEPVHAAGEHVDGDPVRRRGVEFKFPFLTRKRDYSYFDAQTRTSAPIRYKGTRDFRGMEVYYFEQTVPWTEVPVPKTLPKGYTSEMVRAANLTRWYTTVRMFWVDPVTGAPVNGEEKHREEMRFADPGLEPLVAFEGHVKMREDYLDHTVDLVRANRLLVLLLISYLPWGFGAAAAVLLVLSLVLEARSRSRGAPPPAGPAPARDLTEQYT
ncbi:hypothetical protein GCM10027168_41370 [Streptomyces capparidis]